MTENYTKRNIQSPLVLPPSPKGALRISDYDIKLDNEQESKSPLGDLGVDLRQRWRVALIVNK